MDLDGEGAFRYGGRWNSPGVHVVYTSSTLALTTLEYLVHVDPSDVPSDLVAVELAVPPRATLSEQPASSLPSDWRGASTPDACLAIGDRWIAGGMSLGLVVPSVIIPAEFNLLLNPAHVELAAVDVLSINPFDFDPRLLFRV